MRHKKARLQLNRFTSWRKSTIISLTKNLLIQQSIKTTLHRAKAAKPFIEKLISLTKKNSLVAKREAFKILGDHKLVSFAFSEIGPRFAKIQGGYTRIINLGNRRGDDARMVIFELTQIKEKETTKPKKEIKSEARPEEHKEIETAAAVKERPPVGKKPAKKFLGGLRGIFKKERDSL
ncbi:MAG: 50S ribosomal protein L17 [Candidatus Omnitrophota bacterium]